MSALHVHHVRLNSPPRRLNVPPDLLETVRTREAALQLALQDEYGYAWLVDFDDDFVYFAAEGKQGLQRQAYAEDGDGNMSLEGEAERVRPKSSYQPATKGGPSVVSDAELKQALRELREMGALRSGATPSTSASGADYAPVMVDPMWGPPPTPYRPPVPIVPGGELRLHNLVALGGADDYAPLTFDDHRTQAPADQDFMPLPKDPWG
jgi:hypothetical protein